MGRIGRNSAGFGRLVDWNLPVGLQSTDADVLREEPYRFFFYASDGDEPPHVR